MDAKIIWKILSFWVYLKNQRIEKLSSTWLFLTSRIQKKVFKFEFTKSVFDLNSLRQDLKMAETSIFSYQNNIES